MEFGLSEEQLMLADSLRGFLDQRLPMSKLRKIAEGDTSSLGDTSTLADPAVVDDLVANRVG